MEVTKKHNIFQRDFTLLPILILLGFITRLFHITEQSLWHEEFVFIANARVCDFFSNLQLLYFNVPDYGISPGGAVLYYFWVNLFPNQIWVWRLLPILFGIFSIVLLYYFGKSIGGVKVGFLAGLIMTLSPINIFIHQELKSYSFLLFLSLLSWFCLYKYIFSDSQKKLWLSLGAISNLLLPWFHVLYLLVPCLQIIFIFIFKNITIRDKCKWVLFSVLSLIIFAMYLFVLNPSFYNSLLLEIEHLTPKFILTSILGNDCMSLSNELLPEWKTNDINIIHNVFWRFIIQNWLYIDLILIGLTTVFVVTFLLYIVMGIRKKEWDYKYKSQLIYVSLLFFVPPIFLLMLRVLFNLSIFLPLYFYYTVPILYLIISFTISKCMKPYLTNILAVILIILYIIQCLGLISFNIRPDYKDAVEYIDKNAKKEDIIYDLQLGTNFFEVWRLYNQREDITFHPAFSLQLIADSVYENLLESDTQKKSVWVLMETTILTWFYNYDPTVALIKYLQPIGMKVSLKPFPGMFNLYVVKIEKDSLNLHEKPLPQIPSISNVNYQDLLKDFGIETEDREVNRKNMEILQKYITIWPPIYSYHSVIVLSEMIKDKYFILAEGMANYLLKEYPDWGIIHLLKAIVLFQTDKCDASKEEINRMLDTDIVLRMFYRKFFMSPLNCEEDTMLDNHFLNNIEKIKKEGYFLIGNALF